MTTTSSRSFVLSASATLMICCSFTSCSIDKYPTKLNTSTDCFEGTLMVYCPFASVVTPVIEPLKNILTPPKTAPLLSYTVPAKQIEVKAKTTFEAKKKKKKRKSCRHIV